MASVKVTGRCETDDIESCVFRLRQIGTTLKVQGYEGLAAAIEELVRKVPRKRRATVAEATSYARPLPKFVTVYPNAIHKHYLDWKRDVQGGSIRIVKPKTDVLVYLGCPVGSKWDPKTRTCSPHPVVVKTVVPRSKRYDEELAHLKLVHPEVKITHTQRPGVEALTLEDDDLPEIIEAMQTAEVIGE